ncbi:MAG TPA: outer membrane beta-barrel protein [Puia sp.]|nr:outer membrane beta-barrel protein [Puia sp.]
MRILCCLGLFIFLSLPFTTHAQVSIGIQAGPDFAWLVNAVEGSNGSTSITTQKSGSVTQIYGGVYVDIPLDSAGGMFYLRPGIEYLGAGGQMNANADYYNSNGFLPSTKYSLRYVDVPFQFVYSPEMDFGKPWLGLGLYGGALVGGTVATQGSSSQPVKIGNNASDNFKRFDAGYVFSLGLMTKSGFLFGADYQHGFVRAVPDARLNSSQSRLLTRNSVWDLHVGWVFRL